MRTEIKGTGLFVEVTDERIIVTLPDSKVIYDGLKSDALLLYNVLEFALFGG
jgi:hypothetical protein